MQPRTIRRLWAACLVLAGLNHLRILLQHGLFWDYGVGSASAAYWTSLTVIDPAVAWLLLKRPRVGIPATVLLIATNVAHNLTIGVHHAPKGARLELLASSWQVLAQVGFLIVVLATWRAAGRDLRPASG